MLKAFFIFALLLPDPVRADVGLVAGLYQQVKNNKYCFQVPSCQRHGFDGEKVFKRALFNFAADKQLQKNNCMKDLLSDVEKKENADEWALSLMTSWLGVRKSELLLQSCKSLVGNKIEPADRKRYGARRAYEMALKRTPNPTEPVDEETLNLCLDQGKLKSLENAAAAFRFSLPVINHPDFYKWMEKNRNKIISKNTGKPLSDAELLEMDLNDTSNLKLLLNTEDYDTFNASFRSLKKQREAVSQELENYKNGEIKDLSQSTKDFIYEDGTLAQSLVAYGALNNESDSLNSKAASEIPTVGVCMLSQYETTLGGTVTEMSVEIATIGIAALKIEKAFGVAAESLSMASKIKRGFGLGMQYSVAYDLVPEIAKSCFGSKIQSVQARPQNVPSPLPSEIAFERFNLALSKNKPASCKTIDEINFAVNDDHSSSCMGSAGILALASAGPVSKMPSILKWAKK
jgi:hypothetical protein